MNSNGICGQIKFREPVQNETIINVFDFVDSSDKIPEVFYQMKKSVADGWLDGLVCWCRVYTTEKIKVPTLAKEMNSYVVNLPDE